VESGGKPCHRASSTHSKRCSPAARCFVAGGRYYSGGWVGIASAELYDPGTNTWSAAGGLATARFSHTATLLPGGKVLVAGAGMAAAAIFPAWSYMIRGRTRGARLEAWPQREEITQRHWLPNGKVLVAGGYKRQQRLSRQRRIVRSGDEYAERGRQSGHRARFPQCSAGAEWLGARRGGREQQRRSRQRGVVRSGDQHVEGGPAASPRCAANSTATAATQAARFSSRGVNSGWVASAGKPTIPGTKHVEWQRAASPRPRLFTHRNLLSSGGKCSSQGATSTAAL